MILFNPQATLIIQIPFLEIQEQEYGETCQGDPVPEPGTGGPGPLEAEDFAHLCGVHAPPPPSQSPSQYPLGCSSPTAPPCPGVFGSWVMKD